MGRKAERADELRDFLMTVRLATEEGLEADQEEAESVAWRIVSLADEFRLTRTAREIEDYLD